MKIILRFLVAVLVPGFLAAFPNDCSAQRLNITGGKVRLSIGAPLAPGLDPRPDTDSKSRLMWFFPPLQPTKIVVTTVAPGQSFDLFVEATSIIGGTPQPEIELVNGMPPRDFIRDVNGFLRVVGRADLSYRAEAPAATGNSRTNGDDVHTVIYTWVAQ